ncbi:unnamed protein product [Schistosoma mattheei]|uniref:Uncharacterized protein n=1 Tax=Schistosoma mattheei TaxID=31246 RepID=A0A183Q253_9TREM|nr:unnamed protein product [Schistosoma mattheei]
MQLDDLNFVDVLALPPHTQQQMQEKTTSVAVVSAPVELNIHKGKSKILRYNTICTNPIAHDGQDLEAVKTFTYWGSIIDEHGGSDTDVKTRIRKLREAYSQLSIKTKLTTQNTSDPLASYYQQQPSMRENKPDSTEERNQEEVLEVDRTQIEESTQLCHKVSPHTESSRLK